MLGPRGGEKRAEKHAGRAKSKEQRDNTLEEQRAKRQRQHAARAQRGKKQAGGSREQKRRRGRRREGGGRKVSDQVSIQNEYLNHRRVGKKSSHQGALLTQRGAD